MHGTLNNLSHIEKGFTPEESAEELAKGFSEVTKHITIPNHDTLPDRAKERLKDISTEDIPKIKA